MRYLDQDGRDDPEFLALIDGIVSGAVTRFRPQRFYAVKIDNWFGRRWLAFSGKPLGALGVWKSQYLTLPPFIPSRVVAEDPFALDSSDCKYRKSKSAVRLHRYQRSGENLTKRIARVVPGNAVFWYSGNSLANGRGSLMSYIPTSEGYWPWYVGAVRRGRWRMTERVDITQEALSDLERATWDAASGPGSPSGVHSRPVGSGASGPTMRPSVRGSARTEPRH
jgi:hypothetical protein